MHPTPTPPFTTTVSMPLELRAQLDVVRAEHARRTGRRPPLNALILEALQRYVACERDGARG